MVFNGSIRVLGTCGVDSNSAIPTLTIEFFIDFFW